MSRIPLYTQTTHDWHCNKNQPNKPFAVDLNVGTNEYIFGRVTPDNKFIVTTGLVKDPKPHGIKMIGGKKNKKGGNLIGYDKTNHHVYNPDNYRNNELIFNAISKINHLNGLNSPCKNSMLDAQHNISGGAMKKKTTSSTTTKKPMKKKTTSSTTTKKPLKKKTTSSTTTKKPLKKKTTSSTTTKKPLKKKTTSSTTTKKPLKKKTTSSTTKKTLTKKRISK